MNRDDGKGQPLGTLLDALNVLASITWPGGAVIIAHHPSLVFALTGLLKRSCAFQPNLLRSRGLALRRPFLRPDSIPPSMVSAFVFGSASMHSLFQFHHPRLAQAALAIQAGDASC
jgi:hypothetical protein